MKFKIGQRFKNKDKNYKIPLTIIEVIPDGDLYRVSYDPDFPENNFLITQKDLEEDFTHE